VTVGLLVAVIVGYYFWSAIPLSTEPLKQFVAARGHGDVAALGKCITKSDRARLTEGTHTAILLPVEYEGRAVWLVGVILGAIEFEQGTDPVSMDWRIGQPRREGGRVIVPVSLRPRYDGDGSIVREPRKLTGQASFGGLALT